MLIIYLGVFVYYTKIWKGRRNKKMCWVLYYIFHKQKYFFAEKPCWDRRGPWISLWIRKQFLKWFLFAALLASLCVKIQALVLAEKTVRSRKCLAEILNSKKKRKFSVHHRDNTRGQRHYEKVKEEQKYLRQWYWSSGTVSEGKL